MSKPLPTREESIQKVKDFFERFFQWLDQNDGIQFDADIMKRYTIVDASAEGKLVVEVDLDRRYSNGAGLLHGGAVGLIFDMFTTAAHIPIPDFDINNPSYVIPGGYSWAMNYTCLRALPLPARVRVEGNVVHKGRKMNLIRGAITSLDKKKTYYVCEHHKASVDQFPQPPLRTVKL